MTFITVGGARPSRDLPADKFDAAWEMRRAPSPAEAAYWAAVRRGGIRSLHKPIRFNRQQVIRGFIADFYAPAYRSIVEIDGDQHLGDEASASDDRRDKLFRGWGYSILRIRARLVDRSPRLCTELTQYFLETVADGGRGPGYRSRPAMLWRFEGYGVLRYREWNDELKRHVPVARHRYLYEASTPDDLPGTWGGELGDADEHDLSICAQWKCEEQWRP